MYFLHTNPDLAAFSLCNQDCLPTLLAGIEELRLIRRPKHYSPSVIHTWLHEDGMNYRWLAKYMEFLQYRVADSVKYKAELDSLRLNVPLCPRTLALTIFPPISNDSPKSTSFLDVIATHRASYVQTRHVYAEWGATGAPGWFFRLANTILPEKERAQFLHRLQPSGFGGADYRRSIVTEWKNIRNGPMATVGRVDDDEFVLWE